MQTAEQKVKSMSTKDLEIVWEAIQRQYVDEHSDLYGVSFKEWIEIVYSELSSRRRCSSCCLLEPASSFLARG